MLCDIYKNAKKAQLITVKALKDFKGSLLGHGLQELQSQRLSIVFQ